MVVFWPHEVAESKHLRYPSRTVKIGGKIVTFFAGTCPMFDGKNCTVWDKPDVRPLNCYVFPLMVDAKGKLDFVGKDLCPYVDEFKTDEYILQVTEIIEHCKRKGDNDFIRVLGRCELVDKDLTKGRSPRENASNEDISRN